MGRAARWGALALPGLAVLPAAADEGVAEIADVPFEQLLQREIVTADKLARQISDAPSAVSIVTAEEIRTFGYRTLSDILDSMRGLSMSHASDYGYLSGRGYGNAGSYSGRITLLIDGYRAPDNYYGQTYFGNDGLLDVELIERVEYIPGSGSSSYGDSAFLGVINVVTKQGRDFGGVQASTAFGSHGLRKNRLTFGQQFDNGLDVLLSVSALETKGRLVATDSPAFPTVRVENEKNNRYFLKAAYGGWTFESAWVDRPMPFPFDPQEIDADRNSFARLKYDGDIAASLKTSVDLYYGHYRYESRVPDGAWSYTSGGSWRGVDAKLVGTWFDRHTLVLGSEYRDDFKQADDYFDGVDHFKTKVSRRTQSFYAYDDIALSDKLQLNIGGRQDSRNNGSSTFSPRGALVYAPVYGTTLKLSAGEAHRQQTPYSEILAPNPRVERVNTRELVWEQMLGPKTRLIGSLYQYRIDNFLYNFSGGWVDGNYGPVNSKGAEIELEHLWSNGVRLRTSYAHQDTRIPNQPPPANMARHTAKLNLSLPLAGDRLRAGLGLRYLGRRLDDAGGYEPGYLVGDLTVSGEWQNWFASLSVRNLGGTGYNEISYTNVTARSAYPGEQRNFWFQLGYTFK
ncbi:MAG TPA: TonB-dependent receptor [Rhodocyclaceae bacterium]|nr:TonB-dependent receptor [Rhodocyclaceae bacterium]